MNQHLPDHILSQVLFHLELGESVKCIHDALGVSKMGCFEEQEIFSPNVTFRAMHREISASCFSLTSRTSITSALKHLLTVMCMIFFPPTTVYTPSLYIDYVS